MRDLAGDFGKKKISPPKKKHGSHREMNAGFDEFPAGWRREILFTDLGSTAPRIVFGCHVAISTEMFTTRFSESYRFPWFLLIPQSFN